MVPEIGTDAKKDLERAAVWLAIGEVRRLAILNANGRHMHAKKLIWHAAEMKVERLMDHLRTGRQLPKELAELVESCKGKL